MDKINFSLYIKDMIKKNSPVLYKKFCAVVTDFDGDKIMIKFQTSPATPTGKKAVYSEQKVREKDIVILHAETCSSLEKVLEAYQTALGDPLQEVLKSDVYQKMLDRMKNMKKDSGDAAEESGTEE